MILQSKSFCGEWDIFDGTTEYEDNQGQTHTLKAEDYGTCNWYYKNVEVA